MQIFLQKASTSLTETGIANLGENLSLQVGE